MKKRIAKKMNKKPFLYSSKQLIKAFKQLGCPGLTVKKGQHNLLVAGKIQKLNIEGLNYPHNQYNGGYTIDSIDGQTITFSSE